MQRTVDDGMNPLVSAAIVEALRKLDSYVEDKGKSVGMFTSAPMHPAKCNAINAITSYFSTVTCQPQYELCFIFLLHVVILDKLPLQDRAQADYFTSLSPSLNRVVHNEFLPRIYNILHTFEIYDGFDIIDGRLFGRMIWEFTNPDYDFDTRDPAIQTTQSLWEEVTAASQASRINLDFVRLRQTYPRISTPTTSNHVEPDFSLTNFHHPDLAQYLIEPILCDLQTSNSNILAEHKALGFRRALLHSDVTHWHSGKDILPHPSKKLGEEPNAYLLSRRRRNDQLFRAGMQRYAESMAGQGFRQITIVPEDTRSRKITKSVHTPQHKKPKALSTKQKIIASQTLAKVSEERKKAFSSLKKLDKCLTDIGCGNMDKRNSLIDNAVGFESARSDGGRFAVELQVLKIREYIREWEALPRVSSTKIDEMIWIPIEIYRASQEVFSSGHSSVPSFDKIKSVLRKVGFPIPVSQRKPVLDDEPLGFDFPKSSNLRLPCTKEEFQLRFCGPFMEKSLDGKEDERVQFVPDGWQRRVLDILDKNESVIAVAPTSAGKTFIVPTNSHLRVS
jgi:ATP-dependent RNA helicase DDX60